MAQKSNPQPAPPQDKAAIKGVAAELSDEAMRNLTGYFDVLIQMDFASKQRNEQRKKDANTLQSAATNPTQAD